jgi:hypothetical protein
MENYSFVRQTDVDNSYLKLICFPYSDISVHP